MKNSLISIGEAAKLLGVSIDTLRRWDNAGKFTAVRTDSKSNRYFRKSDIDLFINDQTALAKKWVISDTPYEPNSEYFCKTRDVFQARLEHFQADLIKLVEPNLASLVSAVAGEIGNNSFDHNLGNWPDILGVYFSYSLTQKKIILADRGLGILATLKRALPDLNSHQEALKIAFTKTLSGRAPESRGNGLKFVKNVVTKSNINLTFQTGNVFLVLNNKKSDVKIEPADVSIKGCMAIIDY